MDKKTYIVVVVVIVIGILFFTLNGRNSENIKIGWVGPLTGDISSLGVGAKTATEIAVEKINNSGGIRGRKIEVIYEDTKCSPEAGASAGNKLINVDKVVAIIGGLCSGETSAFTPIAMEKKIITIAYGASAPALSNTGKYFFRTYPSDFAQGKFTAEYLYNNVGARKVGVIYHISDYGTGVKDVFVQRFVELGGEVSVIEGAQQTSRDYRTQITKLSKGSLDYVYAPLYNEGGEVFINQLKQQGSTLKIIGGETWSDTKFISSVKGNVDVVFSQPVLKFSDNFASAMKEKLGSDTIPLSSTNAYDAINAYAQAVEKAKSTDSDDIEKALRGVSFLGESGQVNFDKNGDVNSPSFEIKRIKDGKVIPL